MSISDKENAGIKPSILSEVMVVKCTFEQLSHGTLAKIKEFGIKSKSVYKSFRRSCRMLKAYLEDNGLEFSLENGQKWLSEIRPCEPFSYSQHVEHSARRRAVFMLAECQEGKLDSWRIYYQKTAARPGTEEYLRLLQSHEQRLQADGMAKATIKFSMRVDSDFLIYLEELGKHEINEVVPRDVVGYFTCDKFSGRKPDGVKAYAYKLKSFLMFLEETGAVTEKKLSLAVPKVFAKQESIVTVLSDGAVRAIKNGSAKPDAGSAARDHAVMLLALRLGIRRSDIFQMTLADIDWKNDSISFTQQKTGIHVTLPLLPDVGNALMEYILNFRPQVPGNAVFLRHYAPYRALTPNPGIALRYLSVFNAEDCPQRSFHILRRTCSTGMLRNNIPRSVISASIGQVDPSSVDVYLSADEENMRKCALPLKGIECGRGDLR
jgi:integrase